MQRAVSNLRELAGVNVPPAFKEIWERGRYDIVQFGRDFCDFDATAVGPEKLPHVGEIAWFTNHPWARERFLACANRWGKTISASVKLRHHLLYQTRKARYAHLTNEYRALSLSMTISMARLAFDDAFYGGMDNPLYRRFIVDDECHVAPRDPQPIMVVGQGGRSQGIWRSELWARGTTKAARHLLGIDLDFANFDEAARDPNGKQIREDVLLMRLLDREGRLDYTSTGNGKNWYWELFMAGRKDEEGKRFYSQTGPVHENPSIPREAIEDAESRMSAAMREQNIYGGFADVGVFFSFEAIQSCYKDVEYYMPVDPERGAGYVMAGDFGRKQDKTVVLVAETDTLPAKIVFGEAMGLGTEYPDWPDIFKRVAEIHRTYNNAPLLIDSTAMGGDMAYQLLPSEYGVSSIDGHQIGGHRKTKESLLITGQQALLGRKIIWPFVPALREMCDQLAFYVVEDKNISTDWVMAFCLLAEQLQRKVYQEPDSIEIFDVLVGSVRRDWETGKVYIPGMVETEMPTEMDSSTYGRKQKVDSI